MKTYDEILSEMLNNVSDELDKREGSIVYTALAPCAAALAAMYVDLEAERELAFASTSNGEYLDMLVDEVGLSRIPAIKSKRKGYFYDSGGNPFNISLNSRFGFEDITFVAVEKITDGVFAVECESFGDVGNISGGTMLPLDNFSGLASATLSNEFLTYGKAFSPIA